jgi:hypothetical protein
MECYYCHGTGQLPDIKLIEILDDPERECVWVKCRACRSTYRGADRAEAELFAVKHEQQEFHRLRAG